MALILSHEQLDAIKAHAVAEAPNECCGILAGQIEGERVIVREVHPSPNVSESARTSSFQLDPRVHLRIQRECRERGLSVVGFYHSHPEGSAVPSAADIEQAWPNVYYVIISLRQGRPHDLRSWRFEAPTRQFTEQKIEVVLSPE